MVLSSLSLQNFRSYTKKKFSFSPQTTIVVGPNTSGKTNLMEAITILARGKSSRAEKEVQAVRFEEELARIKGNIGDTQLEVVFTNGTVAGVMAPQRRFLVNDIPKRRIDFASHITVVSFAPSDLEVIIDGPSLRREFLDEVLEQVDRQYRIAAVTYTKALRQRNALLHQVQESGIRNEKQFEYWDTLLITHGNYLTQKRQACIDFMNSASHDVVPISIRYDHSTISEDRLLQYKDAEVGAGVTLVGPHRDDFLTETVLGKQMRNVKIFGSRGQQRLVVLQLKLLQLLYIEQETGQRPLLLLDDIFSELDSGHITLVQSLLGKQQTIMTTTHKEFLEEDITKDCSVIELEVDETSS
jgi:DNA replication and repair protein RecF